MAIPTFTEPYTPGAPAAFFDALADIMACRYARMPLHLELAFYASNPGRA